MAEQVHSPVRMDHVLFLSHPLTGMYFGCYKQCCYKRGCKYLLEHLFSAIVGLYLGVGMLGLVVILCLTF